MRSDLEHKTVLVTGAARGIGRAAALAFAGEGARVVVSDIAPMDEVVAALQEKKSAFAAIPCDVSVESDVKELVRRANEAFGGIDVLVNNAGIVLEKPLVETTLEDFERLMSVNLRGVFLAGREVIRSMLARVISGRIINVASELGQLGAKNFSIYSASKGAVIAMTRAWARELAPAILVNAVAPGPVDTELVRRRPVTPERLATDLHTLLERLGRPEEVADAMVFLAGSRATFVTGQVFGVNGGVAMY